MKRAKKRRGGSAFFYLCLLVLLPVVVEAIRLPFLGQHAEESPKQDGSSYPQDDGHSPLGRTAELPVNAPLTGAFLLLALQENGWTSIRKHLEVQRQTYQQIYAFIMYKPPVGMVTTYVLLQLVLSGRLFRAYNQLPSQGVNGKYSNHGHPSRNQYYNNGLSSIMQQEHRKSKRRRHKGRAFSLEERDQDYVSYGVMERIRGRLCVAALADIVEQQEALYPAFAAERSALFYYKKHYRKDCDQMDTEWLLQVPWVYGAALDALQISCAPGGSRFEFVEQLREPLARLKAAQVYYEKRANNNNTRESKQQSTKLPTPTVLQVATTILEIRATDALLRVCRDRLLKTTYRLARTAKYWNRRVEQAKAMAVFQQSLIRDTIEGDRLRLSYAQAAYRAELDRLGRICAMLLIEKQQHDNPQEAPGRPKELQDIHLLRALRRSKRVSAIYGSTANHPWANRKQKRKWRSTWRLPKLSRYAVRIEKGWITIRHLEKDTFIDGGSATNVLMLDDPESLKEWQEDAQNWIQTSKKTLCDVLNETLMTSVESNNGDETSPFVHDVNLLREAWELYPKTETPARGPIEDSEVMAMTMYNYTLLAWGRALHVVDDVKDFRRMGEGRTMGLKEFTIVGLLNEFDFFGIPSAMAKVYLAYCLHDWIAPHWPVILAFLREAWQTFVIFFMTRFFEPAKGVLLSLLSPGEKSMLEDFDLPSEARSLDNMLKDLKFGDGTPGDRRKALEAAALQYEEDVSTGLFRTMASGQLIRLLLVQMQQVKLGMLNAMEDIDVLLQANKLNMRIMAAVPGIFLAYFWTRMFVRHLYNLRSRDLRPITDVYEDMTAHLHRIKSILLLADGATFGDNVENSGAAILGSAVNVLGPIELGEVALNMHCYLVLLDYCSPNPFPKRHCDEIHQSIRETLGSVKKTDQLDRADKQGVGRSMALVDLVIKKHQGLKKYL
ncbi:expressed unknown protein [Seminavis robusta]|uniref:Uncharacterized protein n=1 Tax=Seminavis robusta TaxID=568900 RepID=A0A9N8D9Y3_9STRA|nr:expressed unknown protein [Seminavis robusta]|eukprot:Sro11_g008660.1 n/a (949) ;mRNA; f:114171-117144